VVTTVLRAIPGARWALREQWLPVKTEMAERRPMDWARFPWPKSSAQRPRAITGLCFAGLLADFHREVSMLDLRPVCEHDVASLHADSPVATICSFEWTFCCISVETVVRNVCPSCGDGPGPVAPPHVAM